MLEIHFNVAASHYALYNLVAPDGTVLHIGIVPFSQLTAFNDVPNEVKQDMAYMSILMTDEDRNILANHALETDDIALRDRLTRAIKSWSTNLTINTNAVYCVEDEEQWPSVRACALDRDLTYGQLLAHIAGTKGYDSVKGKTYKKVVPI